MSYAIIRNSKYTLNNVNGIYRHNNRKNINYSNKDINHSKTFKNYYLKKSNTNYSKSFYEMKDSRNLKGQIKKTSNVLCEYIITSDKAFFDSLDENEQKRFFKTAYSFVCNYKQLGEHNIIEAVIHNDETTPHMHLVFIPIVYTRDKNNNPIEKISCSEFWKEKNSYSNLKEKRYEKNISLL